MIDSTLLDLIREATKAAVASALRRALPTVTPGTVDTFDPGTGLCAVLIDGDPEPTPGLPNLSGSWPYRGSRVMVTFAPPHGAAVTHVHDPQGPPSIQVHGRGIATPITSTVPLPFDTIEGGGDPDFFEVVVGPVTGVSAIKVHMRGRYRLGAHVSHTTGAATRKFVGFAVNEVPATPGGVADIQTGAAGVWQVTAARPVSLEAEDIVQVRSLSNVAVNATVESFSVDWIGRSLPA